MPTHDVKPLFKPEVDAFLNGLSDEAKNKLWKVVNALRLEYEMSGSTKFNLPHEKLKRNKASEEDARAALRNLHRNKIASITVNHKVKYSTDTTPAQYSLKNIDERPEIFGDPKTEVELDKDRFSYLEARLRRIQHPVSPFESLIRLENTFEEQNCILAGRALKLIGKELDAIPSLKSNPDMGQFLKSCGVSPEYYGPFLQWKPFRVDVREVYSAENILAAMENPAKPLSKEDYEKHSRAMVLYRILLHYSCSPERNQDILFRILESSIDPLLFDGVVSVADTFKMRMNILLEHAGYFFNGKRVYRLGQVTTPKLSPLKAMSPEVQRKLKSQVETMKRIVARNDERERIKTEIKSDLEKEGHEKQRTKPSAPKQFKLSLKDRQIWVNDTYFLSKPNWTGGNIEFFTYLLENSGRNTSRDELPKGLANVIGEKRFPKILVALGFKGEILKAFCPQRGESKVLFLRTVTLKDLQGRGINLDILRRELELAHLKNSPE